MSAFAEFLERLLLEGRAVLRNPPKPSGRGREGVRAEAVDRPLSPLDHCGC